MKAWKPPVSSWRSRSWPCGRPAPRASRSARTGGSRWSAGPGACASRWTSSHVSAGTLRSAMILRTRGLKTSAPPPGIVSWPAARSRRSASALADLGDPRDEVDLDRREGGQRHVRQRRLELGEQLLVVREVVLLGHPAHDVELGDAEVGELHGPVDELVDAVGVGALVLLGPDGERAEPAADHADVGRVEVRVDVVGHVVAVAAPHHRVGRRTELLERGVADRGATASSGGDPPAVGGARRGSRRSSASNVTRGSRHHDRTPVPR